MEEKMEKKPNSEYILEAVDLCKYFKAGRKQYVKAVDHVNIRMKHGGNTWACRRIRMR